MTDNPDNLRNYESREVVSYYEKQTAIEPCEQLLFEKYVPPGSAILDMGVGAGRTTPALSGIASRYVGADYSSAMIDSCRARFPGIEFQVCDATDMSGFGDGEFDAVVFSFNGIDVISTDEGRARCFSEASRVLKDGGVFIFSSHNARLLAVPPDYRGGSPLQIVWRTIRAAGASIRIFLRGYRAGVFSSGRGYVRDPWDGGMLYFVSTPEVIRREAAAAGLALEETVGSRYPRIRSPWLSPWHYYACRKIGFSNENGDSLRRG